MRHPFNPHKRVNDYQRYSMLTILPLRFMSCTLGNFGIFALSCRRRSFLQVLQFDWVLRSIFWKFLCIWWWEMLWWKHVLNRKLIKNSNLIQPMKNSVCPKAKVIRRPNFSESRICPNIYRMFRSVDRRHDMIIVKWHKVTLIQYFRKPNLSEYLPNVPSVDWTHDMIIVKWHLLIWQKRKLCALTNAPPVQSTQTGQWLSTLFHANYSAAQSMSCTLGNTSSLWAAGDDHFCRYYNSTECLRRIFWKFLCIWWWEMLWWKHVLTRKL